MIWPLFQPPEYEPKERLELTDPRMCHRCGILHKLHRVSKHCTYCRHELKGKSIMPMLGKPQVEPDAGLAMFDNKGFRLMARRIAHSSLSNIIEAWHPVNPYVAPLTTEAVRQARWERQHHVGN